MSTEVDLYRVPTLVLMTALVAIFGTLWLQRWRSQPGPGVDGEEPTVRRRKLMWLAGWAFVAIRLGMRVSGYSSAKLGLIAEQASMEMAPLMFLGSLAPQYLMKKPKVLFVAAFAAPVLVYTTLVSLDPEPGVAGRIVLAVCTVAALAVAAAWSLRRNLIPVWVSLTIVGLVGAGCIGLTVEEEYGRTLMLLQSGVLLMTAYLFVSAFRRLTAGVVFTTGAMALWALPAVIATAAGPKAVPPAAGRAVNLVKVISAMGMVVLVLEDEIASNQAAQLRDRRARLEMEKYTAIELAPMPFEEKKDEYDRICGTIAGVSRFRQAAIFLRGADGGYRLVGRAGMDGALEGALDALARRTTDEQTEEVVEEQYFSREAGNLTLMDLAPLMEPGDELKQMNFRKAYVMGMRAREGRLQGALLLAGLRNPQDPLVTEDVLPLELLVSRIAAVREHQALLRRLMQSERLAGLGQLAGGVAHELNNPLTVVTGYAELMVDNDNAAGPDAPAVILNEARRMRQIIESLMRFQKASPGEPAPVSVGLLLRDIEKLVRPELEAAHVEMELRVPPDLPRVKANGDQIRQVFFQVTKNAIGSLGETPEEGERRLMVEASAIGSSVQVMFSDNGPGFSDTARAFDPFFTTRHPGEGVGLGLSICYAIIREHGGEISAVNLDPHGAAVVIELPAYQEDSGSNVDRSMARDELYAGDEPEIRDLG